MFFWEGYTSLSVVIFLLNSLSTSLLKWIREMVSSKRIQCFIITDGNKKYHPCLMNKSQMNLFIQAAAVILSLQPMRVTQDRILTFSDWMFLAKMHPGRNKLFCDAVLHLLCRWVNWDNSMTLQVLQLWVTWQCLWDKTNRTFTGARGFQNTSTQGDQNRLLWRAEP